jgi:hypothetical protein
MCDRQILNKDFFYIKHQSLILGHDIIGFILTCKMQFLSFLTKRKKEISTMKRKLKLHLNFYKISKVKLTKQKNLVNNIIRSLE